MVTRAVRLEDVHLTTPTQPLTPAQVKDWYRDLSPVRGDNYLRRMEMGLKRALGATPFRAFLMGHSGCGKSTELTRLCTMVQENYVPLRLNASAELDPGAFQPFDVLLVSLHEVIRRTAAPVSEGGAGAEISAARLQRVLDWLGKEEVSTESSADLSASAEAGVGLGQANLLAKVLGLFASARGEAKYATGRKESKTAYRLNRLSDLLDTANEIFQEADAALWKANKRQWLLIWEDFDKPGVSPERVQDIFFKYGHLWENLRCSLIVTVPISLNYADGGARLPLRHEQRFVVPDPAAFRRDKTPNPEGRKSLLDLLYARVAPELFAPDQAEALLVASGGNLRDMLSLVSRAADTAQLRESAPYQIIQSDVVDAQDWLRNQYLLRLGESPYDPSPIPFQDKLKRLKSVYDGKPDAFVPDRVLTALLQVHAVQEFNHKRWLGVHPLVVDILQDQGVLGASGPPPGGTRA